MSWSHSYPGGVVQEEAIDYVMMVQEEEAVLGETIRKHHGTNTNAIIKDAVTLLPGRTDGAVRSKLYDMLGAERYKPKEAASQALPVHGNALQCGYCMAVAVHQPHETQNTRRGYSCECGGKMQDGKPRVHSNWTTQQGYRRGARDGTLGGTGRVWMHSLESLPPTGPVAELGVHLLAEGIQVCSLQASF